LAKSTCPQLSHFEIDSSEILPNMTVLKGVAYSINYNDTLIESSTQIPICSPTAIQLIDTNSFFMLFPNPFSAQLTIKLTDYERTTITLYDLLGQQVMCKTFIDSETINTTQLADGIYFYELRNDKRTIKNGKIIKQ
jgi:hypothetical protein